MSATDVSASGSVSRLYQPSKKGVDDPWPW